MSSLHGGKELVEDMFVKDIAMEEYRPYALQQPTSND